MAAPPSKTIKDLNGKWVMNKSQSDSIEPGLALQGIGWVTRKAVGMTTLTLHVKQFDAPPSPPADPSGPEVTHIEIEQTGTAGFKGTSEKRCLDYTFREHSDWLFGSVRGQTKWIARADVKDPFLNSNDWLEGEAEAGGPAGETHVLSYVESLDNGWTATQIWGFQLVGGERKHVRLIVIAKGTDRVELKLVYDYILE
ncbi:hypothetical protein QBC47DRAFT_207595 [Echria macrotheca]|uniref:LCCL domain-containing protein n=1 Tax=Echria macrotheca TaxID=438768 RepID=A0AAJ0BDZ8_9PEZI|nr:hypothetical protein QBC47DRAFT_207595 [Echria macrotheca]